MNQLYLGSWDEGIANVEEIGSEQYLLLPGEYATLTEDSTDIINGKVKGKFKFDELVSLAKNSIGSIYTNYNPFPVSSGQYLDFNFKIFNKIVEVFFPEIILGKNTSIRGTINSDDDEFKLTIRSPKIDAYKNIIDNIKLQIDNKNQLFNTQLSVDKIKAQYYDVSVLHLVTVTLNDTLFFRTEFVGGKEKIETYDLGFYHTIDENKKLSLLRLSNLLEFLCC